MKISDFDDLEIYQLALEYSDFGKEFGEFLRKLRT
jgi:hypothetical protein